MHSEPHHHLEPRETGHRWFDIAITLCVLALSVSSLVVAVIHSITLEKMVHANEQLVDANSWPFIAYDTHDGLPPGDTIGMELDNVGVGPAKIETVELKWNGVAQRSVLDFLQACCGFRPEVGKSLSYAVVSKRVLRPGDKNMFLLFPRTKIDEDAWKRLNVARISRSLSLNVCWCSVFDQCWAEDVVRSSLHPAQVEKCVAPRVGLQLPEFE